MLKNVKESLAVSIGTEKLFFFIMISVLCIHIMSCMWIFASEITSEPTNWIETGGYEKYPPWKKYLISFYFIVTTATTVGYGDISATNDVERFFAIAFMILGQIGLTYAISLLGSIVATFDDQSAVLQEKVDVLNDMYKEYKLPLSLYQRLKQSLRYKYTRDFNDMNNFLSELPYNLKVETALYIHEENYNSIDFLKKRTDNFIAWICPLMMPSFIAADEHIYTETHEVDCLYFLKSGDCGYVLGNKFKQKEFVKISQGCTFGVLDIYGSLLMLDDDLQSKYASKGDTIFDHWNQLKGSLKRQYTVMATKNSELLTLEIKDVFIMQHEFSEAYEQLIVDIFHRLIRMETLKQRAEHFCTKYMGHEASGKSIRSMTLRNNMKSHEDFKIKPVDFNDVLNKNIDLGDSSS